MAKRIINEQENEIFALYSMRFMFIILLSIFIICALSGASLSIDKKGFSLQGEDYRIDSRYSRLSFSYRNISYGDISRRGLLRTLSNPHSSSSLEVKALPFRKYNPKSGFVFSYSDFDIFLSLENRLATGFSFSSGDLSFAYAYFSRSDERGKLQQDNLLRIDKELMFYAFSLEKKHLEILFIASIDEHGSMSSLLGGKVMYNEYSLEARYGTIFQIDERDDYSTLSIKANIDKPGLYILWSFEYGKNPVYSYELRRKEYSKNISLRLGRVEIEARRKYLLSSKGVVSTSDAFKVKSRGFSFGYTTDSGISSTLSYKSARLSISRDTIELEILFDLKKDISTLSFTFSNKTPLEVAITINL